jgi:hypothetical protein
MHLHRTLLVCALLYLAVCVTLSSCKHNKHEKDKHNKHKIYATASIPPQQPPQQQVPLTDTFVTQATMKANGPEIAYSDVGSTMEAQRAMAAGAHPMKDTVAEQPTPLQHSASTGIRHAMKDVKEAAKHMAAKVKGAVHPTAAQKQGTAPETPGVVSATTPPRAERIHPSPAEMAGTGNTSSPGIMHAAHSVGAGLKDTAEHVAAGLKHTAQKAGGAVKQAAETVKDKISEAGHRMAGTGSEKQGSDDGVTEIAKEGRDTSVPADRAQPAGEPVLLQHTVMSAATHRRETVARTHRLQSDLNRENPEADTEQTHRRASK